MFRDLILFSTILSDNQVIIFNREAAAAKHFSTEWHMTKTGDTFCIELKSENNKSVQSLSQWRVNGLTDTFNYNFLISAGIQEREVSAPASGSDVQSNRSRQWTLENFIK